MLCGAGFTLLGIYIEWQLRSWMAVGGLVILFGFGSGIGYAGYLLMRGESLKEALYFLGFLQ